MDTAQLATKQDVEEIVGRVVGEIVSDALQLISKRFDKVEARMDRLESRMDNLEVRMDRLEKRMDSMEDKLDRSAALVDLHSIDIRALKRKAA